MNLEFNLAWTDALKMLSNDLSFQAKVYLSIEWIGFYVLLFQLRRTFKNVDFLQKSFTYNIGHRTVGFVTFLNLGHGIQKFADDRIRTVDLSCSKQLLYKLTHSHCPRFDTLEVDN